MALGAIWADGLWDEAIWDKQIWLQSEDLIEVPDVVGQAQASAVSTLEGAGFVVSVQEAHSSAVEKGLVISQSPAAGSQRPAGATITITVSLGESEERFAGGFIAAYQRELARRRREREKRRKLEEESERIEEETSREIARLLREREARDARRAELQRLSDLVARFARGNDEAALSERVQKAIRKAAEKQTAWSLFQLEREMRRALEEEEFILRALKVWIEYDG